MKTINLTLLACAVAAVLATTAQASPVALIGWDDAPVTGSNTTVSDYAQNHVFVTGFSGLINDGREAVEFQGSTDGTYGALLTPAATAETGRFEIRGIGSNVKDKQLTITISNGTAIDYDLDALVFDFSRQFGGSPQQFDVTYISFASDSSLGSDDLTLLTVSGITEGGANADLPDYSADISQLTDNSLGSGESAVFRIIASNASAFSAGIVDNIAFTGGVIPEPSTLILFGLSALSLLFFRRKNS